MNPELAPVRPPAEAMHHPLLRVIDPPLPELRWLALGDSFSAPPDGVQSWVELSAAELERSGTEVELMVMARHGALAADVLRRQLPRSFDCRPGLVTVVCGGNDVIRSFRPDIGAFRSHFDALLRAIGRFLPGAVVFTATYPQVGAALELRERTRSRISRGLEAVNDVVRDRAALHGAHVVEFADHPGRYDARNIGADGIHPSADGHREAAALFLARLAGVLPIAPPIHSPDPYDYLEELNR